MYGRTVKEYAARLLGTKFLATLFTVSVSGVLCWFDKIEGAQFVTITIPVVGGYMTARWAEKKAGVQ